MNFGSNLVNLAIKLNLFQ